MDHIQEAWLNELRDVETYIKNRLAKDSQHCGALGEDTLIDYNGGYLQWWPQHSRHTPLMDLVETSLERYYFGQVE